MNLLERIDHWAAVAPRAIAHVSGQRELTFEELNASSNAVAAHLVDRCGPGHTPVAILGHREPEMLVAFIGAVKSGRPYIPIDSTLPEQRIGHILEVAKPATILRPEEIAQLSKGPESAALHTVQPDDPFYIIFTSGSTGVPKGIVIARDSLEFFIEWMLGEQRFVEGSEVFLNQAPFSFDLSVMDLYSSLASGGTLFSISRDLVANPKLLYETLADSNITVWVSTPSFAEMCLIERTFNSSLLPRLRRFLFCGEILLWDTARRLLDRFSEAQVWNFYGPTEATVATTSVQIDRDILAKYSSLPVGRPIPGVEVFIIDERDRVLKSNCRGEIVISGPNVSRGYLARPDLTSERFFETNGQRAYRTGDRGRFCNQLLFFEGRIDNQVKLNGYRIELGDIESNLRALPLVRDAVVLPRLKEGRVQWLGAFVLVSSDSKDSDRQLPNVLRERLRERLPAYMMPRKFLILDKFPLTPNGKVNKEKLAESL